MTKVLPWQQSTMLDKVTWQKTSYYVLLRRKDDISELPPSPNFNDALEVFVCERATTSTLILGEGDKGGGGGEIMLEGRRMFRMVFSPAGFPNFCHNFCPSLSQKRKFKRWGNE